MSQDEHYLATGFHRVDSVSEPEVYQRCLSLLDSLPHFTDYKLRSYDLLALSPGDVVLEAGCGLGDDAFRIAQRVAPTGEVVAVDASAWMIDQAAADARAAQLPVTFQREDLRELSLPDASFSQCRIDRVLQHVEDPRRALSELVRVLQPGGRLLAYDNHWPSFSIGAGDRDTTAIIEAHWARSFINPDIGSSLEDHFQALGMGTITVEQLPYTITDFDIADQIYNLRATAEQAVQAGLIRGEERDAWLVDLTHRDRTGCFATTLTAYMVCGVKD
ncbi:MAG: methyltransferase domain-containing protein [Pseudomonadota bacterium]